MRSKSRQRTRPMAEINVVPYIDVMLVLLVIFMITAPLLSQGVKIDLPKAKAESLTAQKNTPLIISVDAQGNFYSNTTTNPQKPLNADELALEAAAQLQLAQQQGESLTVLVKGDQQANYGNVVQAMVILQQAGVDSVGLMTDSPPQKPLRIL